MSLVALNNYFGFVMSGRGCTSTPERAGQQLLLSSPASFMLHHHGSYFDYSVRIASVRAHSTERAVRTKFKNRRKSDKVSLAFNERASVNSNPSVTAYSTIYPLKSHDKRWIGTRSR